MTDPGRLAKAFERACLAELKALKPGNVHVHASGHGMVAAQFEAAAVAAAPFIAGHGLGLGERIEGAVRASLAVAGCNTNLGIVLLCAPLIAAAERGSDLRSALRRVLGATTIADAAAAYRAIAAANPGGLGRADTQDVAAPPSVALIEAMRLAADRDRIAAQYVTGFRDIFEIGVRRIAASVGLSAEAATEAVYMDFLAAFPDSHITRKFGLATAEAVRAEAASIRRVIEWTSPDRRAVLLAFDTSLKQRGLNPGTSADLTVASLLAADLSGMLRGPLP